MTEFRSSPFNQDRGEWEQYGRPKAIDFNRFAEEYKEVEAGTVEPFECMKQLGMTKPSFYLKKYQALSKVCKLREECREFPCLVFSLY